MTERFVRGKYREEHETIGPSLDAIENAYAVLAALPTEDSVRFFSLEAHEEAARTSDLEQSCIYLLLDALNWFKFFWYTTAFKARQLTEALIHAYNANNYLAWVILGRSTLEYAAVANYFVRKMNQLQLKGPHFAASQIKTFEDLMLDYTQGTRFSWTDLFAGNIQALKTEFKSAPSPKAVNVITALSHLAKRDERYRDVEIAYAMLSDFAHPNMASHATVVEMPTSEGKTWRTRVAVDPGSLRGEFIMVVSTPWISTGVGTSVELLVETAPILRTWVDYIDSNARITFDFTR